ADLRRCLAEWQTHGCIEPFLLAEHDASDRLLIPEKLYGREREIDVLLAAFDRVVAQGTPELVLVSGYSGVGKSSVVNELHKVLVPSHGNPRCRRSAPCGGDRSRGCCGETSRKAGCPKWTLLV